MNQITNLLPTIVPKSDQLNADDLIGGPMTVKVTKVTLCGDADQPVAIHFEGDSGRPYKPCKSMRRVMIEVWGEDGNRFIGHQMTLYRDQRVTFGKDAVGGIRISHVSGIDREMTLALMVTRGQRKPYTVRPLSGGAPAPSVHLPVILASGRLAAAKGSAALTAWWGGLSKAEKAAAKPALDAELKATASAADLSALGSDDTDHDADTGEILEHNLPGHDDEPETEDLFPGDMNAAAPQENPALAWGKDFLAWIPRASAKVLTDAWAEAKREGKPAAVQNADPDLFDALIAAKDARFDELRGAR